MKNTLSVNKIVAPRLELQTVKESRNGHMIFKSFMCEEGRVHDDKDFRREQEKMFSDEVKQFAESKYPEQELDITFHMPFITDVTLDMHSPNGYASPQVLVHFAAEVIRGKEVN